MPTLKTNPSACCQPDFPSLAFDNRTSLHVFEVAAKLRVSNQHVLDLIEEGKLRAVNIAGENSTDRRYYRIPVEAYNQYIKENTV